MSDLEVCEKTLEKRGERHMVPLPLLFNDKNRQVKICLRHRIKNTMASNWTKWAKGTGPTAEKELARKAASKMIQDQAKEVVEKWKASTIEHFGDLDSFTDDEEHLITHMISQSQPTKDQKAQWADLEAERIAARKASRDAKRSADTNPEASSAAGPSKKRKVDK